MQEILHLLFFKMLRYFSALLYSFACIADCAIKNVEKTCSLSCFFIFRAFFSMDFKSPFDKAKDILDSVF